MTSRDIAQWMRHEHEIVEDLAHKLREIVAAVPRAGLDEWIANLRERFDHIRAHLHKHMAMEEHDGYMAAVLERRPTLAEEVDRLKHGAPRWPRRSIDSNTSTPSSPA
ncbi:MAG: hemerythrin domain-containing protein [Planctomycetota bacterium]|jgi:hypothetical protein